MRSISNSKEASFMSTPKFEVCLLHLPQPAHHRHDPLLTTVGLKTRQDSGLQFTRWHRFLFARPTTFAPVNFHGGVRVPAWGVRHSLKYNYKV